MANAEIQRQFLKSGGEKLPPRAPKKAHTPRRSKPIPHRTENKAQVDEYLRGCREMAIFLMNRLDPDGAHCWNCGRKPRRLDLHHVVSRARGGHHTPSNLELWCRECHQTEHGQPMWTREGT